MGKLTMLAAGATGYVLGARAGRDRYDQITATAGSLWRDRRVQARKDQAADVAKQAASSAASQAGDVAQQVASNAKQAAGSARASVQDAVSSDGTGSTTGGPVIPSTDAVPDSGVTPGDLAPPAFPADPGQPAPGEPGTTGAAR